MRKKNQPKTNTDPGKDVVHEVVIEESIKIFADIILSFLFKELAKIKEADSTGNETTFFKV